jgi:hypothetical protein
MKFSYRDFLSTCVANAFGCPNLRLIRMFVCPRLLVSGGWNNGNIKYALVPNARKQDPLLPKADTPIAAPEPVVSAAVPVPTPGRWPQWLASNWRQSGGDPCCPRCANGAAPATGG